MSFRLAVACEDHTKDQYIVKPILEALAGALGKRRAQVHVITSPKLNGIGSLKREACAIIRRYAPISDVVIFIVDADCDGGGGDGSEAGPRLQQALDHCDGGKAIAIAALQEVEVWALWGVRASLGDAWAQVRAECHPKERYFEPQITSLDRQTVDGGRSRLIGASLSSGWRSLATGCPELAFLKDRIGGVV